MIYFLKVSTRSEVAARLVLLNSLTSKILDFGYVKIDIVIMVNFYVYLGVM